MESYPFAQELFYLHICCRILRSRGSELGLASRVPYHRSPEVTQLVQRKHVWTAPFSVETYKFKILCWNVQNCYFILYKYLSITKLFNAFNLTEKFNIVKTISIFMFDLLKHFEGNEIITKYSWFECLLVLSQWDVSTAWLVNRKRDNANVQFFGCILLRLLNLLKSPYRYMDPHYIDFIKIYTIYFYIQSWRRIENSLLPLHAVLCKVFSFESSTVPISKRCHLIQFQL